MRKLTKSIPSFFEPLKNRRSVISVPLKKGKYQDIQDTLKRQYPQILQSLKRVLQHLQPPKK